MGLMIDKKLSKKMNYDKFDFLSKNKGEIKESKLKRLASYFSEGKEIPYPLYKNREKVMNPK